MYSLELPPDPVIREDLLRVVRKVTQDGVRFVLPKTADGRHCDYVPALINAVQNPPELPFEDEKTQDQDFERALMEIEEKRNGDFWEGALLRILS